MSREGGYEIVPVGQVVPTKAMRLKYIQIKKQECKSKIVKAKQDLEDLKLGQVAQIEYQILHAEAELKQLQNHEKKVISSVDTQQA